MISEILLLVEQVCSAGTQVYDLRTAVAILLKPCAFEAIERIADSLATAYHTLVLIVAETALVANSYEGRRLDVAVTDRAFAVAFVAKSSDCNPGLLAAHDKISANMSATI